MVSRSTDPPEEKISELTKEILFGMNFLTLAGFLAMGLNLALHRTGNAGRRGAQQATTCSSGAPARLDGVVRGAEEGLNHQVVSFKSPADAPAMPGMLRKSAAFVSRYQKFESISLQQRVKQTFGSS
jgi:hypothetical protein